MPFVEIVVGPPPEAGPEQAERTLSVNPCLSG